MNFLNGILVLVTKNAIIPPAPTAIKHATSDINIEFLSGIQNVSREYPTETLLNIKYGQYKKVKSPFLRTGSKSKNSSLRASASADD